MLAFDSETALIRPANLAPDPACITWASTGQAPQIVHAADAQPLLSDWLARERLVGHNVAFDLAVVGQRFPELLPAIFCAYDEDRITDTMIRQWLLDTAAGIYRGRVGEKGRWVEHRYALEDLARRCAGIELEKDAWRLSYGDLIHTPLDRWSAKAREMQAAAVPRVAELDAKIQFYAEAGEESIVKALTKERDGLRAMIDGDPSRVVTYPLDDARATLAVWEAQEKHAAYLDDQYRQARAYFALYLSSAWGLRTDPEGVEILRRETQAAYDDLEIGLMEIGLVRGDKKRSRDTKAAKLRMVQVCREERITLRRTDGHAVEDPEKNKCKDADGNKLPPGDDRCVEHVSLDSDACGACGDDVLEDYSELSTLKKVLTNDVQMLTKGVLYPVHTRYGFAETARTTSSKPNIQNLRRRVGIREAFVPREGNVFFSCDYPQLELYTLAQCCMTWLGESKLAQVLNAGRDPHLTFAAVVLSTPYERAEERLAAQDEEIEDVRHLCKQGNFGFPGGLGIPKFERLVRKNLKPEIIARLGINTARLKLLKEQWFATYTEMPQYFARVNALCEMGGGRATVESLFTKRFRGGASYCAACNNGFQALGADCAKEAAWRIARAQYVERESPLFNTRTVAFVHDEFVGECRREQLHDAGYELARLMREGANKYLPDVPIPAVKLQPVGMLRWSKKAKAVFDEGGRLIPWTP
jgi:DNA polymerase-1